MCKGKTVLAAETVTSGDYTYTVDSGKASIHTYNGKSSSVTVPQSVVLNGATYKINTIEANAFAGNAYIKTLVLPKSIQVIGNRAFKNCTSLSSITINSDIAACDEASKNPASRYYHSSD